MKAQIKRAADKLFRYAAACVRDTPLAEDMLFLQGSMAARQVQAVQRPATLSDVEFRVFSQWGEDGILEWLVSRLPGIPQTFIEFGVESFREANCRFLMQHRNWRGLVMDGSPQHMDSVRAHRMSWRHDLRAVDAFITRDNVDELFRSNGFSGPLGVLSIDIDGNDYWVWEAIESVDPWIVACEYNAVFGDIHPITIPYDPEFTRGRKHFANLYCGSSIRAFEYLAERKGYVLLGTNLAGNNAFFVRKDLEPQFEGAPLDRRPRPSLLRESRDPAGRMTHLSGLARSKAIADMPVVNVSSGQTQALGDIGSLYSQGWLDRMGE